VNQEVARAMLQHLGFRVDLACNGVEVLEALSFKSYDLILMDCQMPELDGYNATAIIREKEASGKEWPGGKGPKRRIPIVALTAHAMAGDREICLKAGMDDYLSKPFKLEELRVLLEKWLNWER
jgi:CheY-like chemotaxis protein